MSSTEKMKNENQARKIVEAWAKKHLAKGGILTDKLLQEELRKYVDSLDLTIISFNRLHKYLKEEFRENIHFSEKSKLKNVLQIIKQLEGKKGVKLATLVSIAKDNSGLDQDKVVQQIHQLQKEGLIFSPRPQVFKSIEN